MRKRMIRDRSRRASDAADSFFRDLLGAQPQRTATRARDADLFLRDLLGQARVARFERGEVASERQPTAGAGGRPAITRAALVRWVQTSLNRATSSTLAVDGVIGTQTRRVLSAFAPRDEGRLLGDTLHRLASATGTVPEGVFPSGASPHGGRHPDLSIVCPRPATVLDGFQFGGSTIPAAQRPALVTLARAIARSRRSPDPVHLVCLEGHTDAVGTASANDALGQRRALAVQAELVAELERIEVGLSRHIGMWATSSGEARPVAPNDTDANRARNRRVDVCLNRRWRGGATTGVSLTAEEPAEALESEQQASTRTFRVTVGRPLTLRATTRSLPLGTAGYTWSVADPSIATVQPLGTAQTHPNRVSVRALRPGTTTITVTASNQAGATSTGTGTIVATAAAITIGKPAADTIWPLLHEPEQAVWLTQGIHQGAALWTSTTGSGSLTVTHLDPANATGRTGAAGTQVRANERGLLVEGDVASTATGVNIEVHIGGAGIPLKTSATATTTVARLSATLQPPASGATTRRFEAIVFMEDPSSRFGEVEVRAESVGLVPTATASARVLLVGIQTALVDDRTTNVDGQTAGPVLTENDERFVIDFLTSPQAGLPTISAQTRARRMIVYDIAHRARALGATTTIVRQPEMPMWMAELHLVGVDGTALAAFMNRRSRRDLRIEARWEVSTSWDGPNSASTTRPFNSAESWTHTTDVQLSLTAAGTINGVSASGAVTNAITPAPTAPPFPVAGRRAPLVVVGGVSRRWTRTATATARPTVLIEHQPNLVVGGREVMRGGDGELRLLGLSIDGTPVDAGRIGTATPPAGTPVAMVPTFRIKGVNIPEADRRPLVDALVAEFVAAHATDAWVAMLPLAAWQETMWRVLEHESIGGNHFEHRGTGRRAFEGRRFGHEQDMPIFGPPAGYGWGQLDNPPVTENAAFSFVDNVRQAIDLFIDSKARGAHGALSGHFSSPVTRRDRAVLQREAVRRYNGGTEFQWNGTAYEINPSLAQRNSSGDPNPRLPYPNLLGTTIVYFNGTGATATFPWPIAFPAAQFGPGI